MVRWDGVFDRSAIGKLDLLLVHVVAPTKDTVVATPRGCPESLLGYFGRKPRRTIRIAAEWRGLGRRRGVAADPAALERHPSRELASLQGEGRARGNTGGVRHVYGLFEGPCQRNCRLGPRPGNSSPIFQ